MDIDHETKLRIEKVIEEFKGNKEIKTFENESGYKQIIIQKDIPFMALCEHHHLPFYGTVTIGYIPKGRLIGLSKLSRIAEKFFNPTVYTLQEKGTQKIANYLSDKVNINGAIVLVKAVHGCIAYRGVKKLSETVTIAFNGLFTKENVRREFLELMREK